MSALYQLLVALCTVAVTSAGPRYTPAVQRLGGDAHLRRLEANIATAAELAHVPPMVLAALVWGESRFDPAARSRIGALGLAQLNPRTPMFREWRRVCALSPEDCEASHLLIAARYLRHCWEVCGAGWSAAIVRYRFGNRCLPRRPEVRLAAIAKAWGKR